MNKNTAKNLSHSKLSLFLFGACYLILAGLVIYLINGQNLWWGMAVIGLLAILAMVYWWWYAKCEDLQNRLSDAIALQQQRQDYQQNIRLACFDVVIEHDLYRGVLSGQMGCHSDWSDILMDELLRVGGWKSRIHPEDLIVVEQGLTELNDGLARQWSGIYRFRLMDDHYVDVIEHSVVVGDAGEEQGQALMLCRGIKQIQLDSPTKDQLEPQIQTQKMQALVTLADGVAHDYNNIFGVISGYAELIEHDYCDDEKLLNYVEQINESLVRAEQLSQLLLAFSRRRRVGQKLVDFEQVVLQPLLNFKKTLPQNISFDWLLAKTTAKVRLNDQFLQSVIFNLGNNAVTAMPSGGTLRFVSETLDLDTLQARALALPAGLYLRFSAIDNGCGIAIDDQSRLFDPYFSTNNSVGLGLSGVFGFVQSAQGAVALDSTLHKGTQIMLYFPLQ